MTEKEEIVRKGYDKIAKEYQANRHTFDNVASRQSFPIKHHRTLRKEWEEFANLLPKGAKVLDVGCGAGSSRTEFLIVSGFDVTGVDISESMLKIARKNVPKAKFIKKDMTKMDFEENSFYGLTAMYSIIHVPREKHFSLFQSFHRILKPNGVMLISTSPDEFEGITEYYGVKMFWSQYDSEKFLQIVKDAGFQIIFDKRLIISGEKQYWILARNKK